MVESPDGVVQGCTKVVRTLLNAVVREAPMALRRPLCAATARAVSCERQCFRPLRVWLDIAAAHVTSSYGMLCKRPRRW